VELSNLYHFVDSSIHFIEEHPNLTCFVLFAWSFLETAFLLGLILPAEKVLILSSVLVAKGIVSPFSFVICVFFGTFLGYQLSYFMGYCFGEHYLAKVLSKFGVSEEDFLKVKRFVEKKGELSLVFGRFIPVVRPTLPVVIGAFEPSYLKFTLYNGVGALLWAISYLFLGNLIDKAISIIISHKLISLLLVLGALLCYYFWRRYGKDKKNL